MHPKGDGGPVIQNRTRVTYSSEDKQADKRPQNDKRNCKESGKAHKSQGCE